MTGLRTPGFASNPLREDGERRYEAGTGPFITNRAALRGNTGIPGRHDASKAPTPGRLAARDWRGHRPKPTTRPATLRRVEES